MHGVKNKTKLLVAAPKDSKGSEEITGLRKLILELMKPRTGQLRQILLTRIVPATRDDYDEDMEEWWPDYELFSDSHAITDLNGFLVYTQGSLKGMPDDLKAIAKKFDEAYLASKPKPMQTKSKKYRLVEELINDMIEFITNLNSLCTKMIEERRVIHEKASTTLDTGDRIKVKIFDEKSFVQLQMRIGNLRRYVDEFCALFELQVETKEESNAEPHDKFAHLLRRPLQLGAQAKPQR